MAFMASVVPIFFNACTTLKRTFASWSVFKSFMSAATVDREGVPISPNAQAAFIRTRAALSANAFNRAGIVPCVTSPNCPKTLAALDRN